MERCCDCVYWNIYHEDRLTGFCECPQSEYEGELTHATANCDSFEEDIDNGN